MKCLKAWLESQSCYALTPDEADVFLFNSHQNIVEVARVKELYPGKPFVHRIDGPMRLYNRMSDRRDHVVHTTNSLIADATVFQSFWSREKNLSLGLMPTTFENVILNAPDPTIFNMEGKAPFGFSEKIRLIAVSRSTNENKGFDFYRWLDNNLEFSRYEMVFVGNSPRKFKNIKWIPTLDSRGVAEELKKSDIYITASKYEACSNTLIEALHCGLIALVINNTSHVECMGGRGREFKKAEDIPALIEQACSSPDKYLNAARPLQINEVGEKYLELAQKILEESKSGRYQLKCFSWRGLLKVYVTIVGWKLQTKFFPWLN